MHFPLQRPTAALLAAAGLVTTVTAGPIQTREVAFPLTPAASGAQRMGEDLLETDLVGIAGLQQFDAVRMTDVVLPDGTVIELDLERVDVTRRRFGLQVNGVPAPGVIGSLDLSVWKGTIAGDPESQVMLGFSNHGSRGWIRSRNSLVHLLACSHEDGSWRAAPGLLSTESALNALGFEVEAECAASPPTVAPVPKAFQPPVGALAGASSETIALRECTIAMETDWDLYLLFNDVNAATSYLTTLLSFVSDRYENQVSTVLTFPYLQVYTTSNDPWTTPETGGNSVDMLNEFVAAWQGNIPTGATLGHLMSGASLGGGVAYLDVLCNNNFNFGVSGNIRNIVNFPVVQQPNNWDFMVVAHELGHNFSAPHTHDFCPPIDECAPSGYFGGCQTSQVCTNTGTIMSYCHLCSGGTANITTYFHPDNVALMRSASAACNPSVFEVVVTAPDIVSDMSPTPTSLQMVTGSLSAAMLLYRTDPGSAYLPVSMAFQGGGLWTASIPPVACTDQVDFYFAFDVIGLGAFTAPQDVPIETYGASVGTEVTLFADDFEAATGWQDQVLGASSGNWERGVPVNDTGWAYDPVSDFDGSGSCYLTQNQIGNTDVDGGAVELVSPTFDMSTPGASLRYAYFLNLTDSNGNDRLLVEAREGSGAWVEVTRHDVDRGLDWTQVTLTNADFVAAGVAPGPAMQMRFTANDDDPQSIVEAGLDGFRVSYIDCGGPGAIYCSPANMNSSGIAATIRAEGSALVADNDLTLIAESMPANVFGYFLNSRNQGFVGNAGGSAGNLCLGASIGRYIGNVQNTGPGGSYSLTLNLANTPTPNGFVAVVAGETWNYQSWFRDSLLGQATSNFTDAVSVFFQ